MIIGKKQIDDIRPQFEAMAKPVSIAIDGPAGTGKSTIARALAQKYGYLYFSSGEMYRSLAYACVQKGVDVHQKETVEIMLNYFRLEYRVASTPTGKTLRVFLDGEDITGALHTEEISALTPALAQYPHIREHFREIQREIARTNSVVMEGRDICSVVLPNATHKFYLTASAEERARRRFRELRDDTSTFEEILAGIIARDAVDSLRESCPLKCTDDATIIDTSDLTIYESIDAICTHIDAHQQTETMEMKG